MGVQDGHRLGEQTNMHTINNNKQTNRFQGEKVMWGVDTHVGLWGLRQKAY